jgi:pimeloyl-ACP methyl ester carboxylesterase
VAEFVACGDARIACDVAGHGDALLLMHGAEATRAMFAALVPLLAPHFSVVTYDQRDCGDTESPPRAATLAELADDAHALLQGLGFERAHVFGSSYGGRVAQALVARHPQAVQRLALGSTWPLPRALAELNPEGARRLAELRAALPHSAAELATWFFPEPMLQQQPQLRTFFARVQPASERSQRRAAAVDDAFDVDWPRVTVPTLLLAGELDRIVPSAITFSMKALLPQAQRVLLSGVGHATALQAPARVAEQLIRFFTSNDTAPTPPEEIRA